jgi:cytochrome c2
VALLLFSKEISPGWLEAFGHSQICAGNTMSTFEDAPPGDSAKGAKIFKTKCNQCHNAEIGTGNKQVSHNPSQCA